MIEAFPLHWPAGYGRTPNQNRGRSRFDQSMGRARDFLTKEVERIGGRELIISTNLPVRQDGGLYAADLGKKIDDPGVAIYFQRKDKDVALCCDTYLLVWENIYALGRTLAALRQIGRDGVSDFLDRTFTGFPGLPEQTDAERNIWAVLGLAIKPASADVVKKAYREQAMLVHPDKQGGSEKAFAELQSAYEQALKFY